MRDEDAFITTIK